MTIPKIANPVVEFYLNMVSSDGITLPPFGIYIKKEFINDRRLCRHEQCHWAQYQRMGFIKFYAVYLWLLMRHGYQNHPMEIEARQAEI